MSRTRSKRSVPSGTRPFSRSACSSCLVRRDGVMSVGAPCQCSGRIAPSRTPITTPLWLSPQPYRIRPLLPTRDCKKRHGRAACSIPARISSGVGPRSPWSGSAPATDSVGRVSTAAVRATGLSPPKSVTTLTTTSGSDSQVRAAWGAASGTIGAPAGGGGVDAVIGTPDALFPVAASLIISTMVRHLMRRSLPTAGGLGTRTRRERRHG